MDELVQAEHFPILMTKAFEAIGGDNEATVEFLDTTALPTTQKLLIALYMAQSTEQDVETIGLQYIRQITPQLIDNPEMLSEVTLYNWIHFLQTTFTYPKQQKQTLIEQISSAYPLVGTSPVIQSLLPSTASPAVVPDTASLADRIRLQGYSCMETVQTLSPILAAAKPAPADIAQVITMMASTHGQTDAASWRVEVFVKAVKDVVPGLQWTTVYDRLDSPSFAGCDRRGFRLMVEVYKLAANGDPFPVRSILGLWTNRKAQLAVLREALFFPADVVDFGRSSRKQEPVPGLFIATPPSKEASYNAFGMDNHAWLSIDLIETLLFLSMTEVKDDIKPLFRPPIEYLPELFLLVLAQTKVDCPLKERLISQLLPKYLVGHTNSSVLLTTLWRTNHGLVVDWMTKLYRNDPTFLSRVLDIAQDLKVMEALTVILRAKPFIFGIDLATLAAKREFLNLGKWIQLRIAEHGSVFALACIEFLREYVEYIANPGQHVPRRHCIPLMGHDTALVFFEVLAGAPNAISQAWSDELAALRVTWQSFSAAKQQPNESVEREANTYFQRIYDSSLSIADMIATLTKLQQSSVERDVQVYQCMIHSLFDEYRFFNKYPEKELRITGVLFGALIANKLLLGPDLQLGLTHVSDSLKQPADTKLFRFGAWALEQFAAQVSSWPLFLLDLQALPHLEQGHPVLYKLLHAPVESKPPPSVLKKITPDVLLRSVEEPVWDRLDEALREQLEFVLNTVASNNVGEKSAELMQLLVPETIPDFAQYLVSMRVAIEDNHHETYLALLARMQNKRLYRHVLQATYHSIQFLLASDLVLSAGSERRLLKFLGSWLGELTVARNQPPCAKYLDLHALLLDGYRTARLTAVVPLVCRVLLPCERSRVFRPPNPWLMSLLSLLAETYHLSELRLNTKFEVEVLFNRLQMEVEEVQIRNSLTTVSAKTGSRASASVDTSAHTVESIEPAAPLKAMVISADLPLFTQFPHLRDVVEMALKTASNEIVGPVVERSANIACLTAKELIVKDFAMVPDERLMQSAAHNMVRYLTGNLAVFTGRDILRASFENHLRTLLVQQGLSTIPAALLDETTTRVLHDNVEYACALLERGAWDRAAQRIDEELRDHYTIRRTSRETKGQPFYDTSIFAAGPYPAALPDTLRPSPAGGKQSLSVYQDFALMIAQPTYPLRPDTVVEEEPVSSSLGQAQERLDHVLSSLDAILANLPKADPVTVLRDAELNATIQMVSTILLELQTKPRHDLAVAFSSKVFTMLVESLNPLQMDICLMLLKSVRIAHAEIATSLTAMLTKVLGDRVLNLDAVMGLMRENLVDVAAVDAAVATLVGDTAGIEQVLALVSRAVVVEAAVAPAALGRTLDALSSPAMRSSPAKDQIARLLSQVQAMVGPPQPQEDRRFNHQCLVVFDEWLHLYVNLPTLPEKILGQFVDMFEREGMLKSRIVVRDFFRVVLPTCVEHAMPSPESQGEMRPEFVESVAKFVVVILKMSSSTDVDKTTVLDTFFDVLVDLMQKNADHLDQRPFYRCLAALVQDLCVPSPALEAMETTMLLSFCTTLRKLQPSAMPAFAFSWLQLVSNRFLMPSVLLSKSTKCVVQFHALLIDLFTFLQPFLRTVNLSESIVALYKGTLRMLLVLLHDFPEFLCEYHVSLCDVIPPSCVQVRNLILSAFPRTMRLPDPFLPNLKVDRLPEIKQDPVIKADYMAALTYSGLLKDLDMYLLARKGPSSFFDDVAGRLYLDGEQAAQTGCAFNVSLINSLVLHVGVQGIKSMAAEAQPTPAMEVFQALCTKLDPEGRYYLLNAIANQLRYPNSHTHYFSCILLFLFAEAPADLVREQISKVLLERLIVHRPHPWGLLITFIELIKNPQYNLLGHAFTRCAPEIESLFESVARSCSQTLAEGPVAS